MVFIYLVFVLTVLAIISTTVITVVDKINQRKITERMIENGMAPTMMDIASKNLNQRR